MSENLYRRPSGIYAVRIVVPHRLRPFVGRTEIHASTGLRELNTAKLASLQIQLAWRQRFMELDRSKLEIPSPLLMSEGMIGIRDAASVIGIPLPALLSELLNDRVTIYLQAQGWLGWRVPDLELIDRDDSGAFILNAVEAVGEERILSGLMTRPYDCASTLGSLIAGTTASISILLVSDSAAFFLAAEQDLPSSSFFVHKPAIERIRARLAALLPPALKKLAITHGSPSPADNAPIIYDPITAKHGKKRFSELFELYDNELSCGKDHKDRMTKEARLFIELMDDPELGSIDRETIHQFARHLATLPSDIYLSSRRFKVNTLRELIAIARDHCLATKKEDTVKRHVGHISEIFNYGVKHEIVRFNPAADYKRGPRFKTKGTPQTDRDIFTPDELGRIFSVEWFTTGCGTFEAKGWTDWRPFYYWLPMMGLLTGARINELAQMYLDDIVLSESGVWYFEFNLDQPDKLDADAKEGDKSLKTINAIRVIPMHHILVQLGLPAYAAALRDQGYTRLFPELTHDAVKGYGKPAGSWFNERFLGNKLGIQRNGKKVFHSLRHNFLTALERLDTPESVRALLAGHQRGKSETGTRYSKDRNAAELQPLIDRLVFPALAAIAPFDIPAGLKAVKVSDRFKASMRRGKSAKSLS